MQPNYLADSIFSPQEELLFWFITFVLLGIAAGVISFSVKKLLVRGAGKNPKLSNSLLLGFAAVATIILVFFVIPLVIKDSNEQRKQQFCAKRVGYANPADDNSNIATAETQLAYRQCLGL